MNCCRLVPDDGRQTGPANRWGNVPCGSVATRHEMSFQHDGDSKTEWTRHFYWCEVHYDELMQGRQRLSYPVGRVHLDPDYPSLQGV